MALPLHGVRVLDVTNVLAGPFCSFQLVLLGAEVIKIEHPQNGDLARSLGADLKGNAELMGASFVSVNAGKQSVTLNLKSAKGKEIFKKLAAISDAVIENFRPGVMSRLGLDYPVLAEVNPAIVYCAISGFGQDGPLAMRPAYDQVIQGISGVMNVTGDERSARCAWGIRFATRWAASQQPWPFARRWWTHVPRATDAALTCPCWNPRWPPWAGWSPTI